MRTLAIRSQLRPRRLLVLAFAGSLLGSCASVQTTPDEPVDLSGRWVLDEELSDPEPDLEKLRVEQEKQLLRGVAIDPMDSVELLRLYFPVISRKSVLIEQDEESMGMRFDDQPYMDVEWGTTKEDGWRRSVKWSNSSLVLRSSRGRIRGHETYSISNETDRLSVEVSLVAGNQRVELTRVFRRHAEG